MKKLKYGHIWNLSGIFTKYAWVYMRFAGVTLIRRLLDYNYNFQGETDSKLAFCSVLYYYNY